jgi:hypothetical protein
MGLPNIDVPMHFQIVVVKACVIKVHVRILNESSGARANFRISCVDFLPCKGTN